MSASFAVCSDLSSDNHIYTELLSDCNLSNTMASQSTAFTYADPSEILEQSARRATNQHVVLEMSDITESTAGAVRLNLPGKNIIYKKL